MQSLPDNWSGPPQSGQVNTPPGPEQFGGRLRKEKEGEEKRARERWGETESVTQRDDSRSCDVRVREN